MKKNKVNEEISEIKNVGYEIKFKIEKWKYLSKEPKKL